VETRTFETEILVLTLTPIADVQAEFVPGVPPDVADVDADIPVDVEVDDIPDVVVVGLTVEVDVVVVVVVGRVVENEREYVPFPRAVEVDERDPKLK